MQRIFNPDDGGIPYFDARVLPPEEVGFAFMPYYNEAHVPGRHLNALLTAQALLNVPVDDEAIAKHRRAAFFSFSGSVPFPLNRTRIDGPLVQFADHNLREGVHALYALVRFRGDDEARDLAERCIAGVFDLWSPRTGWNKAKLDSLGLEFTERTFIWGPARMIGPLVKYHRTTGSPRALELAVTLAEKALDEFFREDGRFDREAFGWHTHSATCTLSSLAQLAALLDDSTMLDRVRAFYDGGLWTIRDQLGWVIEADHPERNPDRGEMNNTGDILEAALILGSRGYTKYFEDAERMIRSHMLPAQLRDTSFFSEPTDPARPDGKRDVARRMRGAFGFPAPYGHHPLGMAIIDFCLDIVGGATASLCEAWSAAAVTNATGHRVNMLFDRADENISIESPYTHECLRVTVHKKAPLWVRIPSWVDRSSLAVDPAAAPIRWRGDCLFISEPPVDRPISIRFPLPVHEITLNHRSRSIKARLRGDQVFAMENHGANLTFFPPL